MEQLKQSIINCSNEKEWWDDNIINSFMHILHLNFGETNDFFDCFLISGRPSRSKTSICQFIESGKISLFFPYNTGNYHWNLIVVTGQEVVVYKSLFNAHYNQNN